MSRKKGKKFPIKIKTLSSKPQGFAKSKPCEPDITAQSSKPDEVDINQPRKTVITTEISTHPKIVGQIPPWDDDDEDSQQDDKSKPPTITSEIPCESEKFDMIPRATGEIPPWDDEEESN